MRAREEILVAGDPSVEREWIARRLERAIGVDVRRAELDVPELAGTSILLLAPGQLPIARPRAGRCGVVGVIVRGVADPRRARAAFDEIAQATGEVDGALTFIGHVPRPQRVPARGHLEKFVRRLLLPKYLLDLDSESARHLSLALEAAMDLVGARSGRFTDEPARSAPFERGQGTDLGWRGTS